MFSGFALAVHILEYENYGGYDKSTQKIRSSEVGTSSESVIPYVSVGDADHTPEYVLQHINTYNKLIPYLTSRSQQLCQEFAFFPTTPPRTEGGVFELRTYQLHPGTLLQWENAW